MEREIHNITIIPAKFLYKQEDGRFVIRCFIHDDYTEDRIFDSYSLQGMENPNLLFIGIMTGVGIIQANFCQADEFEDLFKKKWKILVK
jgi:hypothetical protein